MCRILRGIAMAIAIFLSFSPSMAQTPDSGKVETNPQANATFRAGLERETFALINHYREANKMEPLEWDIAIAKVARNHSRDMAHGDVDFGHDGFGKRVSLLKTEVIGVQGAGENVLRTDNPNDVARAAVTNWLHSPHHLKNIRGDYNCSGLGIWIDDEGMIYFTQIFIKSVPPRPEPQAAATEPGVVTPFGFLATPNTRPAR